MLMTLYKNPTTTPANRVAIQSALKPYEPGDVHIDVKCLPRMADESAGRHSFVAIDRATRRVMVSIKSHKTAAAARAFLSPLKKRPHAHY